MSHVRYPSSHVFCNVHALEVNQCCTVRLVLIFCCQVLTECYSSVSTIAVAASVLNSDWEHTSHFNISDLVCIHTLPLQHRYMRPVVKSVHFINLLICYLHDTSRHAMACLTQTILPPHRALNILLHMVTT